MAPFPIIFSIIWDIKEPDEKSLPHLSVRFSDHSDVCQVTETDQLNVSSTYFSAFSSVRS